MECASFITDYIAVSFTNYWHVIEYQVLHVCVVGSFRYNVIIEVAHIATYYKRVTIFPMGVEYGQGTPKILTNAGFSMEGLWRE